GSLAQMSAALRIARSAHLVAMECLRTKYRLAASMQQKYCDHGRSTALLRWVPADAGTSGYQSGPAASSRLQLALELVQEAPIGRFCDQLVRCRLDHADFAQAQRVEAKRVRGIVLAPLVVRDFLQRLQCVVVASGKTTIDHSSRGSRRIGDAK